MMKMKRNGGRPSHKRASKRTTRHLEVGAAARVARALPHLEIVNKLLSDLRPDRRNARTHSDRQIARLTAAIASFGFLVPIIVDADGSILAGHARLEAAKQAGLLNVPCVIASHLSGNLKRAFILAENRIADLAAWDEELLRIELSALAADLDFNIELTGFDTVEVDNIVLGGGAGGADPDDDVPDVATTEPVTLPGTCWLLDNHRLLCGDALDSDNYTTLLGTDPVDMVFTDPPYNVPIAGHASGLGRHKHRHFAMASGEMSNSEFRGFLADAAHLMAKNSRDGALHFVCMDWRHIADLMEAASPIYQDCKNLIVWVKSNGGMGTFYRSRHELIAVFKVGTAAHINNFGLGNSGRYRTNVWEYPGVNTFRNGRSDELAMHPTVKPVALVADAIRDCSRRHDLILDPFAGSGTTLIAAHRTGRIARLIEFDQHYCDVIVTRWQCMTGLKAIHGESGEAFDDMSVRQKPASGPPPRSARSGKGRAHGDRSAPQARDR